VVSERLAQFNGIPSEPLFPPIMRPERFRFRSMNDEIVCICRLEHHKRQHLLVEALKHCRSDVRLRLCGTSAGSGYASDITRMARDWGVADRITVEDRWITEEEKADLLADCLAAAYLPLDEDSYGYPTLEAAHACKPVLTTKDAGGVLEFVTEGVNGLVADPDVTAVARAMDQLFEDRDATRRFGRAAKARIAELDISWSNVLERLLA
jgi:glycosyltransferase involved in cell wall biosynthesis